MGGLSGEIYPNPRGSFQAEGEGRAGGWKGRKEGMDDGCLISVNFTGKAAEGEEGDEMQGRRETLEL